MSKKEASDVRYPVSYHDFYKTNGTDTRVFNGEPSLTRQEFAEECDINTLMKKYEGHGQSINNLPPVGEAQYIDFTEAPTTLLEYMILMGEAERAFMTLPAVVRKEFENNAMMFVDFASDPENLPQMRTWGLAPPAKAQAEAPAAAPAPSAAASSAPAAAAPAAAAGASTHGST